MRVWEGERPREPPRVEGWGIARRSLGEGELRIEQGFSLSVCCWGTGETGETCVTSNSLGDVAPVPAVPLVPPTR